MVMLCCDWALESHMFAYKWTSHNTIFDQNNYWFFYESRKHIIAKKYKMVDTIYSCLDRDLVTTLRPVRKSAKTLT